MYSRTELLLGKEKMEILKASHVLVVGLGGVGAYVAELLCRAGIGKMTIIDSDTVKESNINRQLPATSKTIGEKKVDILSKRLRDINPDLELEALDIFIDGENIPSLFESKQFTFVVDAIDSLAPKVSLLEYCIKHKVKIISSMGAGGRIDPTKIQYSDISKTYQCMLAKNVRKRLKKLGIEKGLPVVFSSEQVNKNAIILIDDEKNKCSTVGTISYLPAIFGCYLSSYVIRKLIKQ